MIKNKKLYEGVASCRDDQHVQASHPCNCSRNYLVCVIIRMFLTYERGAAFDGLIDLRVIHDMLYTGGFNS